MAWIRAFGSPNIPTDLKIIDNGALNQDITFSGLITGGSTYATVTRSGGNNGCSFDIDFTGYDTLILDSQNTNASYYLRVLVDGNQLINTSGSARATNTVDVSNIVGTHNVSLILFASDSTARIYNMILTK